MLAGDAAHMHSPLGGQGLNLGIGDAMNLGWKLAAVARGKADEALLDSYQAERHPVGAKVLDWSRAQVALMRPGAGSRALAAIMADLAGTRDGATYLAERIWGVSQQLDLDGDHPLVGRSAPDFRLVDGRRLGELLRAGQGALLVFDPASSPPQHGQRWQPSIACAADTGDVASGLGRCWCARMASLPGPVAHGGYVRPRFSACFLDRSDPVICPLMRSHHRLRATAGLGHHQGQLLQ